MREIYRLSLSPLITGAALDSLLNFYIKLVKSNRGIVAKIVPSLVLEVEKSTKGTIAPGTAAKCIVKSVETDGQAVIDSLNEFTRMLKV
jgi:cullin-associated NEDD8-dissociated protein 1